MLVKNKNILYNINIAMSDGRQNSSNIDNYSLLYLIPFINSKVLTN